MKFVTPCMLLLIALGSANAQGFALLEFYAYIDSPLDVTCGEDFTVSLKAFIEGTIAGDADLEFRLTADTWTSDSQVLSYNQGQLKYSVDITVPGLSSLGEVELKLEVDLKFQDVVQSAAITPRVIYVNCFQCLVAQEGDKCGFSEFDASFVIPDELACGQPIGYGPHAEEDRFQINLIYSAVNKGSSAATVDLVCRYKDSAGNMKKQTAAVEIPGGCFGGELQKRFEIYIPTPYNQPRDRFSATLHVEAEFRFSGFPAGSQKIAEQIRPRFRECERV